MVVRAYSIESMVDILGKPGKFDSMDRRVTVPVMHREQETTGPAWRALYQYLKDQDKSEIWGGLYWTPTNEGHALWLCDEHRQEFIGQPLKI
jgi:hypothetical protein